MPWLTPDSIPEGDDCRPLSIPADSSWLALVSGALTELTLPYNWQKFGTLTVAETVAKMQEIVDNYYNSPCALCLTPGDYRVTRISPEGHLQELSSSGDWQDATGDYLIPPPDARTEGTPPDQNCLAAKNAANALSQLYESLSESFSSELSTDEAITAFIAAAVAAIGFEFAPITWSIAATGFIIFEALFKALEYVTADLWTEEFTNDFVCLLLGCVNNDAGVVTFDWDCFNAAMLRQANSGGLSEVQLRLYIQIGYMIYFIGGVDGLNLAARTTAITDDTCECEWCRTYLVGDGLGDWVVPYDILGHAGGMYNSGTDKIDGTSINDQNNVWASAYHTGISRITEISISFDYVNEGGDGSDISSMNTFIDGVRNFTTYEGGTGSTSFTWTGDEEVSTSVGFMIAAQVAVHITCIELKGFGTPPDDGRDCS